MQESTNIVGLSPGSLVYIGPKVTDFSTDLWLFRYNESVFEEEQHKSLSAFRVNNDGVHWLNVDGVHNPDIVAAIGKQHNVHLLALEDIMNTRQESKIEVFDNDKLFIVLKMVSLRKAKDVAIDVEQVSFVLHGNTLVSFQEKRNSNIFKPIEERLKASVGKTRRNEADYLLFAIIDFVVDNYLLVLEQVSSKLEQLEEEVFKNIHRDPTLEIYNLKRELTTLRKHAWPLRDILNLLIRNDEEIIRPTTIPYLKDVLGHVNQVIDGITANKELLNSLTDIHYSIMSNRMNSVMKTLTVFSAIFMPLTFLVGVYGMNFDNMPELHSRSGYFWVWGVSILLVFGQLFYFRRRGWI